MQENLHFRLLNGYELNAEATVNKAKPTLFISEKSDTFEQLFQAESGTGKRPDKPNFSSEMVIGIVLPATSKPPKLSVSRVFVQDSMLTIRYIRMTDTTLTHNPKPTSEKPTLVVAIPRQAILKARLVENGKVVQTIQKKDIDKEER